jgi:hypothetical protein
MARQLLIFFLTIIGLTSCLNSADKNSNGGQSTALTPETKLVYNVTVRQNQKDSIFTINSADSTEKYLTELWVSDPECTECKDCYVDSGKIKIPTELKQYIKDEWLKDFFLICNNPYDIEKEAYVKYIIKGQVTGAKHGRPVFCVTEWKRQ